MRESEVRSSHDPKRSMSFGVVVPVVLLVLTALPCCGGEEAEAPAPGGAAKASAPTPSQLFEIEVQDRGEGKTAIRVLSRDKEMISGTYDAAAGRFDETTLRLFGKTSEELIALENPRLDEYVDQEQCEACMRLHTSAERQQFFSDKGVTSEARLRGPEAMINAFGAMVMSLSRPVAAVATAADRQENHCTWSPDFFPQSCQAHDLCYARCAGTGKTRKVCDDEFLADMKAEASLWTLPFVHIYYGFVRAFGGKFWPCN